MTMTKKTNQCHFSYEKFGELLIVKRETSCMKNILEKIRELHALLNIIRRLESHVFFLNDKQLNAHNLS